MFAPSPGYLCTYTYAIRRCIYVFKIWKQEKKTTRAHNLAL